MKRMICWGLWVYFFVNFFCLDDLIFVVIKVLLEVEIRKLLFVICFFFKEKLLLIVENNLNLVLLFLGKDKFVSVGDIVLMRSFFWRIGIEICILKEL